jgi:hypothetical protein
MKRFRHRFILTIALAFGSIIGAIKGGDAKQKFVFKMLSWSQEKRQMMAFKKDKLQGKVLLDDVEMAAFHS